MATRDNNNVRVSGDEMGQILNLKQNLEHHDQLWGYVNRYRALGWEVAVVRVRGGGEVEIDLAQPEESWWKQLGGFGTDWSSGQPGHPHRPAFPLAGPGGQ